MPSVEHVREMQQIEARFALDPAWAETHPHEAKSLQAQKELALYLIGVKPPQTPEAPATPKYNALKAYTESQEKQFEVLTAPDYESFNDNTGKYASAETNQKADEVDKLLDAIAGERRANTAFDSAYAFFHDIGFRAYMAELYSLPASSGDERMHEALATSNKIFRDALDRINNPSIPTQYPHTSVQDHASRIVAEGKFIQTETRQSQQTEIPLRKNIPKNIRQSTLRVIGKGN